MPEQKIDTKGTFEALKRYAESKPTYEQFLKYVADAKEKKAAIEATLKGLKDDKDAEAIRTLDADVKNYAKIIENHEPAIKEIEGYKKKVVEYFEATKSNISGRKEILETYLQDFMTTFLKNAKQMGKDETKYKKILEYTADKLKDTEAYKSLTSADLKSVDDYTETVVGLIHGYKNMVEKELGGQPERTGPQIVDSIYRSAKENLKPKKDE